MTTSDRDRWNERYREREAPARPLGWLTRLDLPRRGRALDVAGGAGRNAVWLAGRGLEVTVVDVSDAGLELAREAAAAAGVAITTQRVDLTVDPLPEGPWDLVVCIHYLQRDLFPRMAAALAPGGLLVAAIATVRNLERHPRPERPYLLEGGELRELAGGLEVVAYEEGWEDDHHEARLVARRPVNGP